MSQHAAPIPIFLAIFSGICTAAETATPVTIVTATTAPVYEEVALNGTLKARRVSRLSSEVEGLLDAVLVDDGDYVASADVVVRLDPELAEISQMSADARLEEAQARFDEAQRRHREMIELVKRQHVPETNVQAAEAEVRITSASLRQSRAELKRAQELVERHVVTAPFAGVISHKFVEVGQWVETNTALVELVETSVLRVEVPVPQFYFANVNIGTRAAIRLDALPDRLLEGHITSKIPVSDSAARTFPVRIEIQNDEGLMGPGMSARVTLRLDGDNTETALLVPRDAIVRKPDGTETVWVIVEEDGDTKTMPVTVTTGRAYRDNVEIVAGALRDGTRVVVRGNEILTPKQLVLIADELRMDI